MFHYSQLCLCQLRKNKPLRQQDDSSSLESSIECSRRCVACSKACKVPLDAELPLFSGSTFVDGCTRSGTVSNALRLLNSNTRALELRFKARKRPKFARELRYCVQLFPSADFSAPLAVKEAKRREVGDSSWLQFYRQTRAIPRHPVAVRRP